MNTVVKLSKRTKPADKYPFTQYAQIGWCLVVHVATCFVSIKGDVKVAGVVIAENN